MADNDDKKVTDDASTSSAQETKADEAVVEETSTEDASAGSAQEVKTDEAVVETPAEEVITEEAAVEPVEEVKAEEPTAEPAPVEKPAEAPVVEEVAPVATPAPKASTDAKAKADKPVTELKGTLDKLAKEIEGLTVLELSELASYLEEKFGVSSAPMMAMGAIPAAGGPAGEPAEEKTSFNVVMTDGGANKLGAIKAVRELRQDLGLMEAKKLVETPPQTILENVKKDEAEAAVKKFTDAGAKAEMK